MTRRPPVWRVLTAPIRDAFRPRAAARGLLGAGRLAFASLVTLNLLVYAGVLIGLMLWGGTVRTTWTAPATLPTATSATAPTALPFWGQTEVEERTIGAVWREWREDAIDGWLGPAELTVFIVLVLGAAGLCSLAWMNLPFVHATGAVWPSYKRALRASSAVLWPLTVLTLAGGALYVVVLHSDYRSGSPFALKAQLVLLACVGVALATLAVWLGQAVQAAAPTDPAPVLSPRCESCGYDLTHQPDSGRCPECGASVPSSLCEPLSRPGVPWQQAKCAATWWRTTVQVLFRPRPFYRAIKLRVGPEADAGFAAWHFVVLALTAWVWGAAWLGLQALRHIPPSDWALLFLALSSATLIGVTVCWAALRVLAEIGRAHV